MVSVCLPSAALLQHLPSYLGFSYLGHGAFLHGCSSKAQPLLLTLDEGYLLSAATSDLEHGFGEEIPLVQGKEQWLCFAGAAVKKYPTPKVRETQVGQ